MHENYGEGIDCILSDAGTIQGNYSTDNFSVDYAWAPATNIAYGTNAWYGGNSGTSKSGTGDVTSSPLFANAGGWTADDFKIQSTSPCKNAGTTISAVAGDYFVPGTARSGTYDIGAHEYR